MTLISTIVSDTVKDIAADSTFSSVVAVSAYDSDINPIPVDKGIVCLGLQSFEIGEKKTTSADDGEILQTNNRDYTAKMKISVFVPYASGADMINNIFDKLCTYLLFKYAKLNFTKAVCGDPEYRRETEALVAEAVFTAEGTLTS